MELKVHDSEIRLQKLWKGRKLFKHPLKTTSGKTVEVLYPGTQNMDAGPDFKDAILKLDGSLIKGDIEVHLGASGWYAHRHHTDPAYNNVVLHIISEEPRAEDLIEREDGVQVQQIYVKIPKDSCETGSEKNTAKEQSSQIVENCPLSETNEWKILATIHTAAEQRLREKVEQLQEDLIHCSWDHLIYKKILEALGYSKNQMPFRRLSELVPFETVCSEMQWVAEEMALKKCTALLYGAAGLLPSQIKDSELNLDSELLDYVAPLEYLWDQMSHRLEIKPMRAHEWQFFRLRPQNFPTRRIAGMVELLFKFYKQGFLTCFHKMFAGNAEDYKKLTRELELKLTVNAYGFWSHHYKFDGSLDRSTAKKESTLIGKDRARDIIVNTVIPTMFLYASESQEGSLKNTVRELFRRFPKLAENTTTRKMRDQLFDGGRSKAVKFSFQQQGLIYLDKLYCSSLRCSECLELENAN